MLRRHHPEEVARALSFREFMRLCAAIDEAAVSAKVEPRFRVYEIMRQADNIEVWVTLAHKLRRFRIEADKEAKAS